MHSYIRVFKILAILISMSVATGVSAQDDNTGASLTFDRLFEEVSGMCADAEHDDGYVYINRVNPDAPFRRARRGILVVGGGDTIRAMEPFSGPDANLVRYASTVNTYSRAFGDSVTVYCMPIPTQAAYYCPEDAEEHTQDQYRAVKRIFSELEPQVVPVDIFPVLGDHAAEPIYLRTDHHWAPLGAYYAAQEFALAALVPFVTIDKFDVHEVPGFVGTMYGFSRDARIRKAPETFVYYTPRDTRYDTYYVNYRLDRRRKNVISASEESAGPFFIPAKGVATYCTFMGGDNKLVRVETGADNGRRLVILKDSYGNALPSCLFNSFEEIHVIDCRYFPLNIVAYIQDHAITDVLFANNMIHATMLHTCDTYDSYLTQ
ncbi:MAG: hypothetical protein K2L69_03700 [Muribaculaceae bacterium]|nr:hypothetical protein [Muribaculaceae bacterium]MDE6610918.1 hypothetical protein [Muribaculaceae bacterium]